MTTRILPAFTLITPTTMDEAVSVLSKYAPDSRIIAGGTDVLGLLKKREITSQYLVDINKIPQLSYIAYDTVEGLKIGPLTTIRDIEQSQIVKKKFPILSEAANRFGTIQVQNMATIGGNLCNASPAADLAIPLLTLNAEVDLMSKKGRRTLPLDDFFISPKQSAVQSHELLVGIRGPSLSDNCGYGYYKISRTSADLAKISIGTVLTVRDSKFTDVRLALGAVAHKPLRVKKTEQFLENRDVSDPVIEEAAALAVEEINPITDIRSTAEYRTTIAQILVKRVLKTAIGRVQTP